MLKVEPTFKLDRTFHGPYRVHDVTPTCASMQPINSPNEETIFVSLQRLSRCHGTMLENAKPWLGHGKNRRRRQVRPRPQFNGEAEEKSDGCNENVSTELSTQQEPVTMTRRGRVIRKPRHFQVGYGSCPDESASQQGGSCKERDPMKKSREPLAEKECEHEATETEELDIDL